MSADPASLSDAALAAALTEVAGKLLIDVRASGLIHGKALGAAGNQTANQFLVHALRHLRPNDGLLSEESKDTAERLGKRRTWIVDPVDGTREYGEARTDWAVHVALTVDGRPDIGAVALPGLGLVLRSDAPQALAPAAEVPRLVVSRTRPAKGTLGKPASLGSSWPQRSSWGSMRGGPGRVSDHWPA